jgi:putative transposase
MEGKAIGKTALLHSYQGFQNTTKSYENQLKIIKIQGSHSRRGNCHDNACIENLLSHLITEKLFLSRPKTIEHVYQDIREFICFYNYSRFQEKFYGLSSIEYQEKAAA